MQTKTMQERLQAIQDLDFTQLRQKACLSKPEGEGWTEAQALEVEKWYKRFLSLSITHPNLTAVPNGPIDAFWHRHILDTQRYAVDCEATIGHFMHHFPYYGLNGEEDAQNRDHSFDETNRAYREYFEEDCTVMVELFPHQKPSCETCAGSPDPCKGTEDKMAVIDRLIDTGGFRHKDFSSQEIQHIQAGASCNAGGSGTGCSRK